MDNQTYDYVIIGSGFGGAVSAMRLTEKGYSVLVLEQGKRFRDEDFATSNLLFWKYLWSPPLRSFGILEISLLNGVMVLHGAGVGGGSLGYANVLEIPTEATFATPAWNKFLPWGSILKPFYQTARRMLGVIPNPNFWPADETLRVISASLGKEATFRATEVGVFFGPEETVPAPILTGRDPPAAAVPNAAAAWSAAAIMPRIPFPRTIFTLPKSKVRKSFQKPKSLKFGPGQPAPDPRLLPLILLRRQAILPVTRSSAVPRPR
jgi:hypothetical protein